MKKLQILFTRGNVRLVYIPWAILSLSNHLQFSENLFSLSTLHGFFQLCFFNGKMNKISDCKMPCALQCNQTFCNCNQLWNYLCWTNDEKWEVIVLIFRWYPHFDLVIRNSKPFGWLLEGRARDNGSDDIVKTSNLELSFPSCSHNVRLWKHMM